MEKSVDIRACEKIAASELRSAHTRQDVWLEAKGESVGDRGLAEQLYILKRVEQISHVVVTSPANATEQGRADLREYQHQLNLPDANVERIPSFERRSPTVTERQKPLLFVLLGLVVALQPFVLFPIGRAELSLGTWDLAVFIWLLGLVLVVIGLRKSSRIPRSRRSAG